AFSRLGRQPVLRRPTEPGDLVRAALKDLEAEQKDRTIEVCILDLPHCEADPGLLKVVFANLLQNALKFTRQREKARIEVGAQPSTDGPIYYIKDNGVGFDMQFTQQLFGMFQRLHRDEDIEGTGVGLATVRRIIDCQEDASGQRRKSEKVRRSTLHLVIRGQHDGNSCG